MRQTPEEQKAKRAEYNARWRATPKGKATVAEYDAKRDATPKRKAARAEYMKEYNAKRHATPERKAKRAEYDARRRTTPERKAYMKEYAASPKQKAKRAEYDAAPERKAYMKEYSAKRHADPEWRAAKAEYNAKLHSTLEGRAKRLLIAARHRAKGRGGVCTLTLEWVIAMILLGCALTGRPFVLTTGKHRSAPSIDRIDTSNPDYTPENSRVILARINVAINAHGLDEYLEDAVAVIKHMGIDINDPKHKALITAMQESR